MGECNHEWGPWVDHDGSGCPLVPGVYFRCTRRWWTGREETDEGVLTEEMANHPSWLEKDEFGAATLVVRYQVRKPRGLAILKAIAQGVEAPVEAAVSRLELANA